MDKVKESKNSIAEAAQVNVEKYNYRNPALDLLRVISLIGVIVMHVTSGVIGADFTSDSMYILKLAYNALFHYGVPIFVMISGALFLKPEGIVDIKKLWIHNILRMTIVYVVWSAAYGIYDYLQYKAGWKYIIWEIVNSRDHLWFLPMLIGLYMIVPILSTWVKNAKPKEIRYFLILFVVFQVICETIKAVPHPELVDFILAIKNIQLVCSYVGYFILGYYLVHIGVAKRTVKLIYICGCICGALSLISLVGLSYIRNRGAFEIVDSYSLFTFGWAVAIFVAVNRFFDKNACLDEKDRTENAPRRGQKISKFMGELGKDSFGAYLCHIAVIQILMSIGYSAYTIPIAIGIPTYVVSVFIISMLIGGLLRRIPFIGRYIC